MKKILSVSVLSFAALMSVLCGPAYGRSDGNLYNKLSQMNEVKVYIGEIADSTDHGKVDLPDLRSVLENALLSRMSINFKMVQEPGDADIEIETDVVEYIWTDEDPIDMITGIGPVILDVIKKEDYARMQARFTVINAKTDKVVWSKMVKATITKSEMTELDSVGLINERIVKIFIRDCFSKRKDPTMP